VWVEQLIFLGEVELGELPDKQLVRWVRIEFSLVTRPCHNSACTSSQCVTSCGLVI
jgi:hypothetical protein